MSTGPLNRLTGALGLLALVPTAIMSAMGNLTATDTAVRAAVTLLLVLAVRKVIGWYIALTASSFERQTPDEASATAAEGEVEGERRRRQPDLGPVAS